MKPLLSFFLLSIIATQPLHADVWAEAGIAVIEQNDWLSLTNDQGQRFFVRSPKAPTSEQAKEIQRLVQEVYAWKSINISRLDISLSERGLEAVVLPMRVEVDAKVITSAFQGGIHLQSRHGQMTYRMRLFDQQRFLKLTGDYRSETDLLEDIAHAIAHPERYLNIYDPKLLYAKIDQLESEVTNLRRTLVALNQKDFCHHERCTEKTALDDSLFSSQRYPVEGLALVKQQLAQLGYPVDQGESWGYLSFKALIAFQKKSPLLEVTGELDAMNRIALANPGLAKLDYRRQRPLSQLEDTPIDQEQRLRLLQRVQMALGQWSGQPSRFDGQWLKQDLYQLIRFQEAHRLKVSGYLDPATLSQLFSLPLKDLLGSLSPKLPEAQIEQINTGLFVWGYNVPNGAKDWDARTTQALASFQQHHGLVVDGQPNEKTLGVLFQGGKADLVLRVQQWLAEQGYSPGDQDGRWGPKTQSELKRFQQERKLKVTGWIDAQTLKALQKKP